MSFLPIFNFAYGILISFRPVQNLFTESGSGWGEELWLEIGYSFGSDLYIKTLSIVASAISFFNAGSYLTTYQRNIRLKISYGMSDRQELFLSIIFCMGVLAYISKSFLYLSVMRDYDYFYLYTGNFTLPLWIRIMDDFLWFSFVGIISLSESKVLKKTVLIVTFVALSSILLTGMRGEFVPYALTILIATRFLLLDRPISNFKLIFVGLFIFIIVQLGTFAKNVNDTNLNVLYEISNFFWSQGATILVPSFFLELFEDRFNIFFGTFVLLSSFIGLYHAVTGQYYDRSIMDPYANYFVGEMLQYELSPDQYYNGLGTGSSFVAEFLAFGFGSIGVAFLSLAFGFLIRLLEANADTSKIHRFIFLYTCPVIIYSIRAPFSKVILNLISGLILYYFLSKIFLNKKIKILPV